MNQAEYFKATVPEPWTILGLDLKPFSAGHLAILHRIESPLVGASDAAPEWMDLALALAICSKRFQEGIELLNDPNLSEEIGQWLASVSSERGELQLDAELEKFLDYLQAGCVCPEYIYKEGGSDIGDVPPVQFVRAFLMSNTSITSDEFWNQPWALSMWDFLTIQAQKGHLRLCSGETIADAQKVGENLARLISEGKLKCQS